MAVEKNGLLVVGRREEEGVGFLFVVLLVVLALPLGLAAGGACFLALLAAAVAEEEELCLRGIVAVCRLERWRGVSMSMLKIKSVSGAGKYLLFFLKNVFV